MMCFKSQGTDEPDDSPRGSPPTGSPPNDSKMSGTSPPTTPPSADRGFFVVLDSIPAATQAIKLGPISAADSIASLAVPTPQEQMLTHSTFAAAKCVSTYPQMPDRPERDGDPICDLSHTTIYEQRVHLIVADGCGWGRKPRDAAVAAVTAFEARLKTDIPSAKTVGDVLTCNLNAMTDAHQKITVGKRNLWEAGTTTLSAAIIIPLEEPGSFALVGISVGDGKVLVYDGQTRRVRDLTAGNRPVGAEATDCGGRIGPQLDGGKPDLRNLRLLYHPMRAGDVVFLVSDGVHDNLDPQFLNIPPVRADSTGAVRAERWDQVGPAEADALRNRHREEMLEKAMTATNGDLRALVESTITHCTTTTQASRDFLISNSGVRLPVDYALYPGKMDHATMVCCAVRPSYSAAT